MAVAFPAMFDLIATFFQNLALVFISASICQMLRGSICVFTAIQRRCYFGFRTKRQEWAGIWLVVLGLAVDGLAALWVPSDDGSSSDSDAGSSTLALRWLGMFLIFLAQAIQAFQTVVEESLLHNAEADDMLVVFLEGAWGLLFTTVVFMPLAQVLPGVDGEGVHEDVWPEEVYMLSHSMPLMGISLVYILVVMAYNATGMIICNVTEATTKNVIDAARTLGVWVVAILIEPIDAKYGEKLGWWSMIEFAGFVLLTLGMFVYYDVVSVPCLREPPAAEAANTLDSCAATVLVAPAENDKGRELDA
jgi:hypothetical protein